MTYKCIRVLNNSVVLAERISDGTEVILLGKGIGVNVSKNKSQVITEKEIQRLYELKNNPENDYLKELINSVSPEIISITFEIIKMAEQKLNTKFRVNLFFTILDHLSFAVERNKDQLDSNYRYLEEMKILFKEEYEVCELLVDYINISLGINLKNDEAVLLSIHFANARLDLDNSEDEMINEIMNIISIKLDVDLNEKQAKLHRLKTHLRLFINTNSTRSKNKNSDSFKEIESVLSKEYNAEYQCARLIVEFLRKKHKMKISNDEVVYLTMHIIPIVTKE
ncbi:PRD domain-containing protein [Enterococcus avium]|uniref:PRD domain-containing protein n=1 Tax=Enterococcus avium TaxID=33945 RepID=UPI00289091ED|nr:PRD domain-containing protein [Enterococcus avium]MDT2464403.1 PRD domain-containing protein [Enterococcus avium]MDT2503601.1 PRD domain-containing protein [Enterococcus avium]